MSFSSLDKKLLQNVRQVAQRLLYRVMLYTRVVYIRERDVPEPQQWHVDP